MPPGGGSNGVRLGLAALLVLSTPASAAELPASRLYRTVPVAEGVLAFVSPETSGPIPSGNVVAIAGEDAVLVVDSGRFPSLARRMIAEIREKTGRPVRYLAHTHWHLDHVVGDGEFRAAFPRMSFLATDFTRRKMIEKQVGYLRDVASNGAGYISQIEAALAKGSGSDGTPLTDEARRYLAEEVRDIRLEIAELSGAPLVEPDVTFDRTLTVQLGGREARVSFLGRGNTAGDAVVFVPDARVVVTGDLLVAPVPYGYGCHPRDWIATLETLRRNAAAAIVPGHGPVMRDWSYAGKVVALLEELRRQVGDAVASGATLEQTRRRVDLTRFETEFAGEDYGRRRAFRNFFVLSAVERAWQEARGALVEE